MSNKPKHSARENEQETHDWIMGSLLIGGYLDGIDLLPHEPHKKPKKPSTWLRAEVKKIMEDRGKALHTANID